VSAGDSATPPRSGGSAGGAMRIRRLRRGVARNRRNRMQPFAYTRADDVSQAGRAVGDDNNATFLAGGTTLVDLMKLDVETPRKLVDINGLPLSQIEPMPDGGFSIGANVRNSDLAYDPRIIAAFPVLSEALLSGASPQLRNMATVGGNLMQRTRCYYYRDVHSPCNMREPGSGCSAIGGFNRIHAVLGTSGQCIATHPSDMCVALAALDAIIHIRKPDGSTRQVNINAFYIPYGDDPSKLTVLEHGELITRVDVPSAPWLKRSAYRKVRDRASYEFALASAAVALDIDGGEIKAARVALGGVGSKPWRSIEAESALVGKKPTDAVFAEAGTAALRGAVPQKFNAFKIEMGKRTVIHTLQAVMAMG
jgi:xanthine dehydrogenase YagS FAD-binding subunit